jgi:hypothetical protein
MLDLANPAAAFRWWRIQADARTQHGDPSTPNLENPRHPQHHYADAQAYLKKHGARKVEASALVVKPEAARDLCRDAILRYVDGSRIP